MKKSNQYTDINGTTFDMDVLDGEERKLAARLLRRAKTHPDWFDYGTYWMRAVAEFYDARGLPRKKSRQKLPYRIGQDQCSRLGIASGLVKPPSYRGELNGLIDEKYKSRSAFCQATGISEDMLSHVLAGRKDLSLSALEEALSRIGYRLRIVPTETTKKTG